MKVSGLNINPGLVKMQHRSNMISQMLNGGGTLPSFSGAGSARSQAAFFARQYDTFERISSQAGSNTDGAEGGSTGSTGGTAREQAREIMKEYRDAQARAASGDEEETEKEKPSEIKEE